MMADGLINPLFTKSDFQKEKNVALEGIKSIEKDVQTIAGRVHSKLRYGSTIHMANLRQKNRSIIFH